MDKWQTLYPIQGCDIYAVPLLCLIFFVIPPIGLFYILKSTPLLIRRYIIFLPLAWTVMSLVFLCSDLVKYEPFYFYDGFFLPIMLLFNAEIYKSVTTIVVITTPCVLIYPLIFLLLYKTLKIALSAQQGDAPEPDSSRSCLSETSSRPGDL